ncbi:MAG: hypothetical protein KDI15_05640, partial [Thiothrix sp.]|nr:hypothetical protein [Thiothrix sp.]
IHQRYTREIYDNLRYRPTWLPGTPIQLGSVGIIESGIFRPVTSLERLNVAFEAVTDASRDAISYNSKTGVSITFKAAGDSNPGFEAITKASAGALIEFSRHGAIVLQLQGAASHRIADQPALYKALLRAIVLGDEDQWQRNWVAITEVVQAESATIVISGSADSKLELKASGSAAPASLVDASAGLSVARESQVSTRIIAESGLTPLYRGVRVRRGFLWLFDEVQPASALTPEAAAVFGDAAPEDDSPPL